MNKNEEITQSPEKLVGYIKNEIMLYKLNGSSPLNLHINLDHLYLLKSYALKYGESYPSHDNLNFLGLNLFINESAELPVVN